MSEPASIPPRMPVACGALGSYDPAIVSQLARALEAPMREVHRDGTAILSLDREPLAWSGVEAIGAAWRETLPASTGSPSSWREASVLGACGLAISNGHPRLHSSVSGIGPVYWLLRGEAIYFATRWDALAEAVPGELTPDWESWASIVVLGCPPGDGTPIAGIRRLPPYSTIELDPSGNPRIVSETWPWAEVEPSGGAGLPRQIIDQLAELLSEIPGSEPVICPLSGGWDSRVLACLLANQRDDVVAWTVNAGLGDDVEERIAADVALALDLPHRFVDGPKRQFADQLDEAARMVGYETQPHLAMAWLADRLGDEPGTIVDGIAGDTLIKGLTGLVKARRDITEQMVIGASDRELVSLLVMTTSSPRRRAAVLSPEAAPAFAATAEGALARETARFDGHPSASLLALYWSRTRRWISTAPVSIFGRRHAVAMPFADHDVARLALSAGLDAKAGSALYRELLRELDPRVGPMPSTNDKLPFEPERRRQVQKGPMARRTYAAILARSPLRPWLSDTLEQALTTGRFGLLVRPPVMLREIQALCGLTLLTERFAGRLDPTLPDLRELAA